MEKNLITVKVVQISFFTWFFSYEFLSIFPEFWGAPLRFIGIEIWSTSCIGYHILSESSAACNFFVKSRTIVNFMDLNMRSPKSFHVLSWYLWSHKVTLMDGVSFCLHTLQILNAYCVGVTRLFYSITLITLYFI